MTIDTNVLVRAITEDHPVETPVAKKLLAAGGIVITNQVFCELIWVLRRVQKAKRRELAQIVRRLMSTNASFDRLAVEAGLAFLDAGGDFADGVITLEGRRLGGETFATFDRKAAAIMSAAGEKCLLLTAE